GIQLDPFRRLLVGFLGAGPVLKDAGGNHRAGSCVSPVVSDKPWDLADQRDESFGHPLTCLARIGDPFVPSHRDKHIFLLLPVGSFLSFPIPLRSNGFISSNGRGRKSGFLVACLTQESYTLDATTASVSETAYPRYVH